MKFDRRKNCLFPVRLGAALSLAFFFGHGAVAFGSADQINCDDKKQLAPGFDTTQISSHCTGATTDDECRTILDGIKKSSDDLQAQHSTLCGDVGNFKQKIMNATSMGQRDSAADAAQLYAGLESRYEIYIQNLDKVLNWFKAAMVTNTGPLGPALSTSQAPTPVQQEKSKIRDRLNNLGQNDFQSVQKPEAVAGGDKSLFAAQNGAAFMKKIFVEKADANKILSSITSDKDTARRNAQNSGPPPSTDDKTPAPAPAAKSNGIMDGLDLKSLAALGTAGAGIASVAQSMKQQQDSAATNTAAGTATSPTPDSKNTSASKPELNSSKLGTSDTAPSSPKLDVAGPAKTDPAHIGGVPGGVGFHENSDISKTSGVMAASSTTPAAGKPTGGGGASGASQGGDSSSAAKRDPSAASAADKKEDDSLQGIGGGGLGGGGPSSGGSYAPPPSTPPVDPAAPAAEDSMKDLLHDMKDAADGTVAPGEGSEKAASDIAMESDDLFPRVRACYVRVLKQGRVLNGLGEPLPE